MRPLNYFGEEEQAVQRRFQSGRDGVLSPLIGLLARLGVTPDHLSLLGVLCLGGFALLVLRDPLTPATAAWASGFILAHVLLDGLDGPLARRLGTAGPAGALVDMLCDHGGLVIVVWVLSAAGLVDGTLGNVYVFTYTLAVVWIVWLNMLGRPFRWVLRTKYLTYGMIFVYGLTGRNSLDYALALFTVSNVWLDVLGFLRVRRALRER